MAVLNAARVGFTDFFASDLSNPGLFIRNETHPLYNSAGFGTRWDTNGSRVTRHANLDGRILEIDRGPGCASHPFVKQFPSGAMIGNRFLSGNLVSAVDDAAAGLAGVEPGDFYLRNNALVVRAA